MRKAKDYFVECNNKWSITKKVFYKVNSGTCVQVNIHRIYKQKTSSIGNVNGIATI